MKSMSIASKVWFSLAILAIVVAAVKVSTVPRIGPTHGVPAHFWNTP